MKKVILGMFVLGLTSLGFSQENNEEMSAVELAAVTVSALNLEYLAKVQQQETPIVVQELQHKAARLDITTLPEYDKEEKSLLGTKFKATNGSLTALYASNGQLVSSRELFTNVALPIGIQQKVFEANPGWEMKHNRYVSTYWADELRKKE